MPLQDLHDRDEVANRAGTRRTSGQMTVKYRDAQGKSHNAIVLGQGTASGLKLRLPHVTTGGALGGSSQIIDNVPAATGQKDTNAYFAQAGPGTPSY